MKKRIQLVTYRGFCYCDENETLAKALEMLKELRGNDLPAIHQWVRWSDPFGTTHFLYALANGDVFHSETTFETNIG